MQIESLPHSLQRVGKQAGFVLVSALMFLLLLTILGLAASRTASVEALMAANFRDLDRAFSATEAALRDAEIRITGYYAKPATPVNPYGFNSNCTNGLCDSSVTNIPSLDFFGAAAPGKNSVALGTTTGSSTMEGVASQPRYLVEYVCRSVPGESETGATCQYIYRVTAQGRGLKSSTRITLQETFIP